MSGVAKGIKKVFKTVGKVVKKIAPFALPAAAAIFTIGGALGIPAMAGGFGGAVSSLFGNSVLGKVAAGAITQAGYGGLAGSAIGGIAGGGKGALKGSLYGQAAGAVTGSVTGMIGAAGNPQARAATGSPTQATMPTSGPNAGLQRSTSVMQGYGDALPGQVGTANPYQGFSSAGGTGLANTQAAQGVTQAAQQLPSSAMTQQGLSAAGPAVQGQGLGNWMKNNEMATAYGVLGLTQAIPSVIGALTADDEKNQALELEKYRRNQISKNYAGGPLPSIRMPTAATTPVPRYIYEEGLGRIVRQS